MIILVIFAFLAGVVTILSPCILPILPIVLSGSLGGGKSRPLGIITGFIFSFTFFTLFLTTLVRIFNIPADSLRTFSVIIIAGFGLTLVLPSAQSYIEKIFARFSGLVPRSVGGSGYIGGLVVGLSLGLLWTPCVGPILASVISLALTGTVTGSAALITLAYSAGTALPMLAITYGGRNLLRSNPWLLKNSSHIQKVFGLLMILTSLGIFFNLDRKFQTYVLTRFPNYGIGLTRLEDNPQVKRQLEQMGSIPKKTDLAPKLIPGGLWFNSEPLTLSQLRGKVVLIDFWTYTCINCIRTLPYLKAWDEKYRDQGLVIIGVHTPEFEFEKDSGNVSQALSDFEIKYPVMQDNNYATWQAYGNRYWPAKYLIDSEGKVVYTHFGEGEYDTTEAAIQSALAVSAPINNPDYVVSAQTPELYLGSDRYQPGYIDFSGRWKDFGEYRQGTPPNTVMSLDFNSKDVYLVMGPRKSYGQVTIQLDGQPVTAQSAGKDVSNGKVEVSTKKAYHLISLPQSGKHTLTITVTDVFSVEFYAFTFG